MLQLTRSTAGRVIKEAPAWLQNWRPSYVLKLQLYHQSYKRLAQTELNLSVDRKANSLTSVYFYVASFVFMKLFDSWFRF